MSALTINLNDDSLKARVPTSPGWKRSWFPQENEAQPEPDCTVFMRQDETEPEIIEGEIAVGNVSIVPGGTSRTKPAHSAVVDIDEPPGYAIVWDLPRPWPTWFPIGRETWRRFALYPLGRSDLRRRAQKIACGVFRPEWRAVRKAFGPTNMRLPDLSPGQANAIANIDAQRLALVRAQLPGGFFKLDDNEDGVQNRAHGWAWIGPPDPGAPAGSGIYFGEFRQSQANLSLCVLMAPTEHERMIRFVRRDTGEILTQDDYMGMPPDLWGSVLPETVGVPNYDPIARPMDYAHNIRGVRRTATVAEQMDSPMARRSIAGVAAEQRMRFSDRGRLPGPGYHPVNLNALLKEADAAPHKGIWGKSCGRMIGWAAWETALDIKINGTTPEKQRWAQAFIRLMETAATPAGVFQKGWGDPFPEQMLPDGGLIRCMQTFEYVILGYGACGLGIQTGQAARASEPFLRGFTQIYSATSKVPIKPWYGGKGPWKFLYIADDKLGVYTVLQDGVGVAPQVQGDATHAEAACALAHSLTKDPMWLEQSAKFDDTAPTWQDKKARLLAATRLDWEGFLLGQYQEAP